MVWCGWVVVSGIYATVITVCQIYMNVYTGVATSCNMRIIDRDICIYYIIV